MTHKLIDKPSRISVTTTEIEIKAPVETVFDAWFNEPDQWFYENEDSKTQRPTRCDKKLGGHFYMQLPDGGFNSLGQITMIKPNYKIRMRGDCTMPWAVVMNMTISFEATSPGATRVSVDHRMMGEFDDNAPAEFEEGWLDGLTKLKALLESR